jgi:hypothetical protein
VSAAWVEDASRQFPDRMGLLLFERSGGNVLQSTLELIEYRQSLAVKVEELLNRYGSNAVLEALVMAGLPIPGVFGGEDES